MVGLLCHSDTAGVLRPQASDQLQLGAICQQLSVDCSRQLTTATHACCEHSLSCPVCHDKLVPQAACRAHAKGRFGAPTLDSW